MVGLIEDASHIDAMVQAGGDLILLLGKPVDTEDPCQGLGGSAYLQLTHQLKTGLPPRCDLDAEKQLHDALRGWIAQGIIQSAHDCSEGGLAVTLAECCISGEKARHTPHLMGASIQLEKPEGLRLDALLLENPRRESWFPSPPTQKANFSDSKNPRYLCASDWYGRRREVERSGR